MAKLNVFDSVYEQAASFGRDVLQYIVTGAVFVVVSSVPWRADFEWEQIRQSSQITVVLVTATILFGLGHVLLAVGFWIQKKIKQPSDSWWDRSWNWVLLRLARCRVEVEEYNRLIECTRQESPKPLLVGDESAVNVHVGMEMTVLLNQPRLHTVFIERFSRLLHLRLGLAAAFLVAGVVNASYLIWPLKVMDLSQAMNGVVGVISIMLGLLLMRLHLETNTNFLHRLIVAFRISDQANS